MLGLLTEAEGVAKFECEAECREFSIFMYHNLVGHQLLYHILYLVGANLFHCHKHPFLLLFFIENVSLSNAWNFCCFGIDVHSPVTGFVPVLKNKLL